MTRTIKRWTLIAITALPIAGAAQSIDGVEVLDGLGIPAADVAKLEQGGILAYSDEEYESTRRELAADAIVLVDTDIGAVERTLGEALNSARQGYWPFAAGGKCRAPDQRFELQSRRTAPAIY